MKGLQPFFQEIRKIVTNKKVLIPFLAVLMVPLMYSGMFLWAFWNPYDNMNELPVAVVNEDEGATYQDKQLHVGEELITNLKDSKDFNYHFVTKDEAYAGIENQDYYMLIEIPNDFSQNATTLLDEEPQKLELSYIPNESFNFLSSQIGESALEVMKAEVGDKVTKTYAEIMYKEFEGVGEQIQIASEKAIQLDEGAASLSQGSEELYDKLQSLASKSVGFKDGIATATSGSRELEAGTEELANGLNQLGNGLDEQLIPGAVEFSDKVDSYTDGVVQAEQGMKQVDAGIQEVVAASSSYGSKASDLQSAVQQLNEGTATLSNKATDLSAGISQLESELQKASESLPEEQKQQLLASIQQLSEGADGLATGVSSTNDSVSQLSKETSTIGDTLEQASEQAQQLVDGSAQVASGMSELRANADALDQGAADMKNGLVAYSSEASKAREGANKLVAGATDLSDGLDQLNKGSNQLTDGSQALADGAGSLTNGVKELEEGTTTFSSELATSSKEANELKTDENTYGMMSSPVNYSKEAMNEVPNYGTGFTPYFLSLGLFVGALLMSIVFNMKEPVVAPTSATSWFLGKFGILLIAGVIQAVIAASLLLFGLDLQVESVGYFYAFSILSSLGYMALIQFLVTTMGDPGRFIAIIILILQLTTSAGTFPLELIPDFLQAFNPYLPMTYTVNGFKAIVSSGDFSYMWDQVFTMSIFMFAFLIGTWTYLRVVFKKSHVEETQDQQQAG
ncbi:membrane protein [Pontibacillus halophilus JSM 076056 = DSM 19796]|uniref:Membrane protein n=1 Tax=Pontibacillus halophilus JSM 076056 = DSM 19796 TaxID=1385510 RepID=A0A0A5GLG4_9BACI|nr:YhgE/Pip domain-containing protein [Pontibacillus halophilus]KGX92849.1 membrane protein [Pontibacillus halophilus JSM 076056 = DSM 19796]